MKTIQECKATAAVIYANLSEDERQDCAASPLVALGTIQAHRKGMGGLEQDWTVCALQQLCQQFQPGRGSGPADHLAGG